MNITNLNGSWTDDRTTLDGNETCSKRHSIETTHDRNNI